MHEGGGSPHQRLGEGVREDIGRHTSQSPPRARPNSFRSSLPSERRIGLDSWWCTAEKLESEADKSMAFFFARVEPGSLECEAFCSRVSPLLSA